MSRIVRFLPPFLKADSEPGSDHSTLIRTLQSAVETAEGDVTSLLSNAYFLQAKGEYLDEWGKIFGISRLSGEGDESYRERIIKEVTLPKQTKAGLKRIVSMYSDIAEADVVVYEPHTELYPLNGGFTANESRIPDYKYWTWALIDIQTPDYLSDEVKFKVENTKAAGVQVIYTYVLASVLTDTSLYTPSTTTESVLCVTDPGGAYYVTNTIGKLNAGGIA
jgi:hypothetical protein